MTSDIGAIESGRWHASHLSWKIGAMSFVNVGTAGTVCAEAAATGRSTHTDAMNGLSDTMAPPVVERIELEVVLRNASAMPDGDARKPSGN